MDSVPAEEPRVDTAPAHDVSVDAAPAQEVSGDAVAADAAPTDNPATIDPAVEFVQALDVAPAPLEDRPELSETAPVDTASAES